MRSRLWLPAILLLFFGYLLAVIYIYDYNRRQAQETAANLDESADRAKPDSTLLSLTYKAFDRRDWKEVRRLAAILNEEYPESVAARDANRLLEAIDSSSGKVRPENSALAETSKPVVNRPSTSKPPQNQPSTANRPSGNSSRPTNQLPPSQETVLAKMRHIRDAEAKIDWYYNKHISHYLYKNSFESYIGRSDAGDIWLRLRIYYSDEKKALNMHGFDIYADDKIYPLKVKYGTLEKGRGPGGAWEWFDMQVQSKDLEMLRAVMMADRAAVKYLGEKDEVERTITEGEKQRLLDVVQALDELSQKRRYLAGTAPAPR